MNKRVTFSVFVAVVVAATAVAACSGGPGPLSRDGINSSVSAGSEGDDERAPGGRDRGEREEGSGNNQPPPSLETFSCGGTTLCRTNQFCYIPCCTPEDEEESCTPEPPFCADGPAEREGCLPTNEDVQTLQCMCE